MTSLSKIEISVNKATNTIRIFSVLLTCTASAFLLGASYGEKELPMVVVMFLVLLFSIGLTLMFVSEIYWRILKKDGKTEERLMYFYNFDKKIFK